MIFILPSFQHICIRNEILLFWVKNTDFLSNYICFLELDPGNFVSFLSCQLQKAKFTWSNLISAESVLGEMVNLQKDNLLKVKLPKK